MSSTVPGSIATLRSRFSSVRTGSTNGTIAAVFPWFAVVGAVYGMNEAVELSPILAILTASPIAYLMTGLALLGLWIGIAKRPAHERARITALSAVAILVMIWIVILAIRIPAGLDVLVWVGIAIVGAAALTGLVGGLFFATVDPGRVDWLGLGVVFAHLVDATTTGIGIAMLGTVERNPVAAWVIEGGELLPVAYSGVSTFLVVKLFIALALVSFLGAADARDRYETGVLVFASGFGLAPATHNAVLFAISLP